MGAPVADTPPTVPGKLERVSKAFFNKVSHTVGALGNGGGGGRLSRLHTRSCIDFLSLSKVTVLLAPEWHLCVISQFLWARNWGTGELGPLPLAFSQDPAEGVGQGCASSEGSPGEGFTSSSFNYVVAGLGFFEAVEAVEGLGPSSWSARGCLPCLASRAPPVGLLASPKGTRQEGDRLLAGWRLKSCITQPWR